ncbi:eCIS core domain-containing protein [Streptomyces sp. NPDC001348]
MHVPEDRKQTTPIAAPRLPAGPVTSRAPVSSTAAGLIALQRTAGNAAVARAVAEGRHEHDAGCGHVPSVQRRALVHKVLDSPGQSMDPAIQREMEARFGGADFSHVRVHTGALARESAVELQAKAYTSGNNVVVAGAMTKEDWAHELTHVEDQMAGPVPGTDTGFGVRMSEESDSGERHAVEKARRVMSGPVPVQPIRAPGAETAAGPTARGGHATPMIQRTAWEFVPGSSFQDPLTGGAQVRWQNETNPADIRTSAQLGIGAGVTPRPGDRYDDVTRQHHSSANVTFSKKGTIPDRDYPGVESRTRRAVVEAKEKIASVLAMLQAAGGNPGGPLLAGLRSGFPAFRSATPQQIATFLPRITEVVRRIQAGLNSGGAEIALVGAGTGTPSDVAGWVAPSARDIANRVLNPNQQKSEELPTMDVGRSGPINLTEKGQNAWYIIHEATHRFAGTLDYQYSPYDQELEEEGYEAELATVMPDQAAARDAAMLGKRAVRDPGTYTGKDEPSPAKQPNWYAMGRRALMNADSYAQFILTATGTRAPRT